jgi:hypothetical protein
MANVEIRLRDCADHPLATGDGFPIAGSGQVTTPNGARWHVALQTTGGATADHLEMDVVIRLEDGAAGATAIDIGVRVNDWQTTGYTFAPAMVYAGNRFEVVDIPYSPFWPDARHYAIDKPVSITQQPHLATDGSAAGIELNSLALATPCIGCRAADGRSVLIFADDECGRGLTGFTLWEDPLAGTLVLSVSAPGCRSRIPAMMGFQGADPLPRWEPGTEVRLRLSIHRFAAPTLADFFQYYARWRKHYGTRHQEPALPFGAAATQVRHKLDNLNWDEQTGYYRHGINRESTKPYDWWQLGWVTGGITTLPMLVDGPPPSRQRALRNLEFMFGGSPLANGLWHAHHDGRQFNIEDPRPPRPGYLVSVRRLGDGLYYGLKQLGILTAQQHTIPTHWDTACRNLADVLCTIIHQRGMIGHYLDARSADIGIGGSTAGGMVPAALCLAAKRYSASHYLQAAITLARHLRDDWVAKGLTCGGPCDCLGAPDSESAYAVYASFVELYLYTGAAEWQAAAEDMLALLSSWVTSRDVAWPSDSALGLGRKPANGTVWANVQNKHAAPGLCTYSGEQLFRFWRATGNPLALDLLTDITHALPHYVALEGAPIGDLQPGMMCERVNISDWEGAAQVGGNIFGSTIWVETAMLLTAAEIPSVYWRTDSGIVQVFDHLAAAYTLVDGHWRLHIRNPTAHDTVATVLVDDAVSAHHDLGPLVLERAIRVAVPAGGERWLDVQV